MDLYEMLGGETEGKRATSRASALLEERCPCSFGTVQPRTRA